MARDDTSEEPESPSEMVPAELAERLVRAIAEKHGAKGVLRRLGHFRPDHVANAAARFARGLRPAEVPLGLIDTSLLKNGKSGLLLRIDLRDYLWDASLWNRVLTDYPYGVVVDTAVSRAVLVNTATRMPVVRAVQERKRAGKIRLITTDLFGQMIPHLEHGTISASIYQDPYLQGQTAVRLLVDHLTSAAPIPKTCYLNPGIVLRSNLRQFREAARK